jgi:hypothetical protein
MNKVSIRGVVVGGVIDIVATVILTLPLVVAYAIPTEVTGTLKDLLQAQGRGNGEYPSESFPIWTPVGHWSCVLSPGRLCGGESG